MNLPGGWELVLVVLVIMVLFGAKRLPEASRSLGRSLRIFKAETKGLRDDERPGGETTVRAEQLPPPAAQPPYGSPQPPYAQPQSPYAPQPPHAQPQPGEQGGAAQPPRP